MTMLPAGVKVHLAYGYTDMRKGMDGLALMVQEVLHQDPFSGHLFVFRGRKANLIKVVYWDGTGMCLFTKRLEHGVFLWPASIEEGRTLSMTSSQLGALLDGIDWRSPDPVKKWRIGVETITRFGLTARSDITSRSRYIIPMAPPARHREKAGKF